MPTMNQDKVSRDEVIRSRLLHSLGIHKTNIRDKPFSSPNQQGAISTILPTSANRPANINVKLLSNDAPIRRSLNDIKEHNRIGIGRHYFRRPSMQMSRKRSVRFNSIVTEKQIASHKKYSNRIKRTLWSDTEEIQENAYRNQIEYQAEGMNWESVLENEEMYVDAKTGELIHPFWVESEDSLLFS